MIYVGQYFLKTYEKYFGSSLEFHIEIQENNGENIFISSLKY